MLEWIWESLESSSGQSLVSLLRGRFRYGLVDEFQDTDDLQWKIFRRIFLDSAGSNILYVVGDPKQAIYGFRGADVFTYLDARREILESGGSLVKLVENYRSTGDCVNALNSILDEGAKPSLFSGEIRYDSPVKCGRPDRRARRPGCAQELGATLPQKFAESYLNPIRRWLSVMTRNRAAWRRKTSIYLRALAQRPPR
jgi:exodeoxyribonuclease V beta subunit